MVFWYQIISIQPKWSKEEEEEKIDRTHESITAKIKETHKEDLWSQKKRLEKPGRRIDQKTRQYGCCQRTPRRAYREPGAHKLFTLVCLGTFGTILDY